MSDPVSIMTKLIKRQPILENGEMVIPRITTVSCIIVLYTVHNTFTTTLLWPLHLTIVDAVVSFNQGLYSLGRHRRTDTGMLIINLKRSEDRRRFI